MLGFHASETPCSYGWVLHVVSLGIAAVIVLIAALLAWWG
jgi:hypothetical protein